MSERMAKRAISYARQMLKNHESGDPAYELSPEDISKFHDEIEAAEAHIEDEPDDLEYDPTYDETLFRSGYHTK